VHRGGWSARGMLTPSHQLGPSAAGACHGGTSGL
jgi:hypothetical protein